MSANPERISAKGLEQRKDGRTVIGLPATIRAGDADYSSRLLNLSAQGAMLETSAPVQNRAVVTLRCGSIFAKATVAWTKGQRAGIRFSSPLSDRDIEEQAARSAALAAWQSLRR